MKHNTLIAVGISSLAILALITIVFASQNDELADVRSSTAHFHRPEAAQAAGWDLVPGLDHCFNKPNVGAMGYHYINTALLDTELNPLQPEAMVYESDPRGKLKLAAVEYIVPAEEWDASNSELPKLHGQSLHLNSALGVYVLHAWIWKHNPSGIFHDWNPLVSCP
jgi:hypothetical protein